MKDKINPQHYKITLPDGREIESIEIVKSIVDDFGSFCHGNAIKYLIRANEKHDTPLDDIRKAKRFLEFWEEYLTEDDTVGGVMTKLAVLNKILDMELEGSLSEQELTDTQKEMADMIIEEYKQRREFISENVLIRSIGNIDTRTILKGHFRLSPEDEVEMLNYVINKIELDEV